MKNLLPFIISIAVVGVQVIFAAKQSVAVLPSDGVLNADELDFFTNKAQEIAVKVLPKSGFEVFPQEVVFKRLGGVDSYVKECKEISCIVELGRKAMVDYVAQCRFGKFGSDLTVTFELYQVSTSGLIDKFVDKAKTINGLLVIMEKRIPDSFMKIPGAAPIGGETSGAKNDAEAYYKRGVEYDEKGDYDKAISEFTEAIRLKPDYAEAYSRRGTAYVYKEDYDKAISDLNEAIRLNPKYEKAYYWRGGAYFDKKDYDRAISDYNEAIRLDPKYDRAYYWRGNAYYGKGYYNKAIADYKSALRIDPSNSGTANKIYT